LTASLLASLLATSPPTAFALQRVEAKDGVSVEAAIALKEPTRIKIDGAPVSDVFGNIYSTNCGSAGATAMLPNVPAIPQINPAGELVLECDKDKGEK
jgi:conjugal transfer pilus assembly protein TraK